MPEGPEVKIASDFLNNTFEKQVIIKVEVLTEYFEKKYFEVFQSLRESLIGKELHSFTIGKNTFIKLNHNSFYNYHLGMTKAKIKIEAGTHSGRILRLKSKGIPSLNGYGKGDLLVHINLWTPQELNKEEKIILEKLKNSENFQPNPNASNKSFFEKVKEMFN